MFEARDAERLASSDDRRMWRLLLARLHPDAGGDHDLFAFACTIRDEMSSESRPARSTQCVATPFLRTWREAMGRWSTSNHESLQRRA